MIRKGKKSDQQKKRCQILIYFLMEEMMLSNLQKTMGQWFLNPKKATEGKGLKILTRKQMLQKLPIALAQIKAGNNSENYLNEIRQIVYSLYQSNKNQ